MLGSFNNELTAVLKMTWPMLFASVLLVATIRIAYLINNKMEFVLHKECLYLSFMLYILCLFQVVTAQDINMGGTNNFIPFQEILRYSMGSRLFVKNIIGNVVMFIPYGFFVAFYTKLDKYRYAFVIVGLASISIECMQLVIGRIFDVDDILLNICGGMLGFFLYSMVDKIGNLWPKVFKSKIFLNIIMSIIVIVFITFIVIGR